MDENNAPAPASVNPKGSTIRKNANVLESMYGPSSTLLRPVRSRVCLSGGRDVQLCGGGGWGAGALRLHRGGSSAGSQRSIQANDESSLHTVVESSGRSVSPCGPEQRIVSQPPVVVPFCRKATTRRARRSSMHTMQRVAINGPGQLCGEEALLKGTAYTYTVQVTLLSLSLSLSPPHHGRPHQRSETRLKPASPATQAGVVCDGGGAVDSARRHRARDRSRREGGDAAPGREPGLLHHRAAGARPTGAAQSAEPRTSPPTPQARAWTVSSYRDEGNDSSSRVEKEVWGPAVSWSPNLQ